MTQSRIATVSENVDRPDQNSVSLVIRAWREKKDSQVIWHFRVHDPKNNQDQGIAGLESLVRFLEMYFGTGKSTPNMDQPE